MELWTTQIGGVADTLDTCSSPTCYQTKFGCSMSSRVGVGRGPKNLGDAGTPSP